MQLMMFAIPALNPGTAVEEMNRFLRSHRVLSVDRQLVGGDTKAYWAVSVEYLETAATGAGTTPVYGGASTPRAKVDYRDILSESDFAIFGKLRDVRKAISEKDAVPPYTVFTNEQLAGMVTTRARSLEELAKIDGIGAARMEKYAPSFLPVLIAELPTATAQVSAAATKGEDPPPF